MKVIDFIDKWGNIIISLIIFINFSISSCYWIISSPYGSNFGKFISISFSIMFGLSPYIYPFLVRLLKLYRELSGVSSYSEELQRIQQSFKTLFIFVYTILLFVLNRVMNFIEYNMVSDFYLKLIYIISTNFLFGFSGYVIKIKPEWNRIITILFIFNLFAFPTLFL